MRGFLDITTRATRSKCPESLLSRRSPDTREKTPPGLVRDISNFRDPCVSKGKADMAAPALASRLMSTRPSPSSRIRARKRGFCDFSDGQVIDLERVRPSVLAENGCSEDLPDSQARDGADRFGRIMFLRRTERKKNGKAHSYWNVVENKRLDDGRVVQRHVLYLGEINSSQAAAWRKAIEVFDEDAGRSRTLALFPEDRCEAIA